MKKESRRLRIRPLLSGLAVLTGFAMTGCSFPGSSSSGGGRTVQKIYVIGQSQGISFWDDVEQGASDAAEEFGYEIHYSNAESVSDVQSQIDLINQAIAQNANAIVISPNDEAKLKESVQAARDAGIVIITINADFEDMSMRSSYVGTNNLTAGKIAGRHIVEALNDPVSEKILVVTHSESANSAVSRVSGMCLIEGPAYGQAMQKAMQEAAMARAAAMQQGGGQGNAGGPPAGAQQGEAGGPPAGAQQGNAGGPPADAQQGNAGGPPADAQQGEAGG
ncbi:MAG: substrate-binding domain-containing protein, partial [Oscillospiraceae bacterium]|nr:substrate-binding domain-containing protein [Oscillospiraceae bacterium]